MLYTRHGKPDKTTQKTKINFSGAVISGPIKQ